MSDGEPFDFGTIRLQPASWGVGMLTAECMRPTCGWVMTFSTNRLDTIIETCRDDDERVARAAYPNVWHVEETRHGEFLIVPDHFPSTPAIARTEPNAEHIARWDPARVLAEVDAKRSILNEWQRWYTAEDMDYDRRRTEYERAEALSVVVKLLALPYAGREGWREEWRP